MVPQEYVVLLHPNIIVIIALVKFYNKDRMSNRCDGKCDVCGSEYLWYDTSSAELCYTYYQKAIEWSEKK